MSNSRNDQHDDQELQRRLDHEMPKLLAEMEQRLGTADELRQRLSAMPQPAAAPARLPMQRVAAAAALLVIAGLLWWGLGPGGEAPNPGNVAQDNVAQNGATDHGATDAGSTENTRSLAGSAEIAFGTSIILQRDGRSETFSNVDGAVRLVARDTITVGQEGSAEVRFPDGSVATYSSGSHFTLDFNESGRPVFRLEEGSGSYSVQKQSTGLAVVTPIARVVVVGTEFDVVHDRWAKRTGQPLTSVSVREGEVHVSAASGNGRLSLLAGDQASVTPRSVKIHARPDALSVESSRPDVDDEFPTLFGDPAETNSRQSSGSSLDLPKGQRR